MQRLIRLYAMSTLMECKISALILDLFLCVHCGDCCGDVVANDVIMKTIHSSPKFLSPPLVKLFVVEDNGEDGYRNFVIQCS